MALPLYSHRIKTCEVILIPHTPCSVRPVYELCFLTWAGLYSLRQGVTSLSTRDANDNGELHLVPGKSSLFNSLEFSLDFKKQKALYVFLKGDTQTLNPQSSTHFRTQYIGLKTEKCFERMAANVKGLTFPSAFKICAVQSLKHLYFPQFKIKYIQLSFPFYLLHWSKE